MVARDVDVVGKARDTDGRAADGNSLELEWFGLQLATPLMQIAILEFETVSQTRSQLKQINDNDGIVRIELLRV